MDIVASILNLPVVTIVMKLKPPTTTTKCSHSVQEALRVILLAKQATVYAATTCTPFSDTSIHTFECMHHTLTLWIPQQILIASTGITVNLVHRLYL